jgi:hypothetical protein
LGVLITAKQAVITGNKIGLRFLGKGQMSGVGRAKSLLR